MFNPFEESTGSDATDVALAERANEGDKHALDELIRSHQGWIYNIAVRMVWEPRDAEDATQEVLIKVITKLGSFKAQSKFRTWLYRIVVNHVINMKRRGHELHEYDFAGMGDELDRTPDLDLPDPDSVPVDLPLLVEEAKVGCTTAMLLCLDRRQRLVFVLAEMFGVTDQVGGELLEISPDNFRQCLARARRDLYSFMNNKCGLINDGNPCRCAKKTRAFMDAGFVDPGRLRFVPEHLTRIRDMAERRHRDIAALQDEQYASIFRDHPFLSPPELTDFLRRTIADEHFRRTLDLDSSASP
jgi:RNA polymerase sigma factor (sigma-70 family)